MSAASPDYPSFIEEVFLKPIRSVLAIDDEYPTLDKLLASTPAELSNLPQDDNWNRLRQLTEFCRKKQPRELLLDVHDGKHGDPADHLPLKTLRQCDWVVLDYQLNGTRGDGRKCCDILRKLAESEHFNLVSVYTQKPISEVFHEIIESFSAPLPNDVLGTEKLDGVIEDWEDEDPGIGERLIDSIGGSTYFRLNQMGYWKNPLMDAQGILREYNSLWSRTPKALKSSPGKLGFLKRIARSYEERVGISLYEGAIVSRHADFDSENKWLLVGNLFVSLVNKTDTPPDKLLENLLLSLTAWNPPPNRLALAKLRAVADAIGFKADSVIMENNEIQAYWLKSLLEADNWERREHIEGLVDRQTELLIDKLRSQVVNYTERAISNISGRRAKDVVAEYFGQSTKAEKGKTGHNTIISNRPVSGSNLIPGHIFEIPASKGIPREMWICLSPACDLIPFRTNGRASLTSRLGGWLPFTAVKLHSVNAKIASDHATHGHIVFLKEESGFHQYSIYEYKNEEMKNPEWEEFFVASKGVIAPSQETHFKIARLNLILGEPDAINQRRRQAARDRTKLSNSSKKQIRSMPSTLPPASPQAFEFVTARMIGQLRAEYAANLTQKFTSHLSRIGLEYC